MSSQKHSPFGKPILILIFAGMGCFLLSFIAMGLAPWSSLKNVTRPPSLATNPYFDEEGNPTAVGRGRKTYIKEACWHCHSQFVRPVAGEPYRYGPASQAWESMYDIPQTFGTRRIGPDLSRESGRRSDDWHFAHLYNPRSVAPSSVMPSYPWYFESNGEPKQEAKDLVAYLQYLGEPFKEKIQSISYPRLFKVTGSPVSDSTILERGETLFKENCTGCHGVKADGNGKAVAFLKPRAVNLVGRFISTSEVYSILNRGVLGSAMPSFREMPEKDLWALAAFVSDLGSSVKEGKLKILGQADHLKKSQAGKKIYAAQCVLCHGANGEGDGLASTALNPRPKDFTRRIFSKAVFEDILSNGVPGSAMPAFSALNEEEREELYHAVLEFYDEKL